MRFYLALILSAIMLISQPSWATPGYRIDEQATAQAQWKPGEVVAEGTVYWDGLTELQNYYRKFIGITDQGYAVVQDFYADSGNKFTDPYVVMQPDRIGDIRFLYKEMNISISAMLDGEVVLWYENGQKGLEGHYQDGMKQGLWTWWHENGQIAFEGNHQDGKQQGLFTGWYPNGKKRFQGTFQDGKEQGLWTYWDENGQKYSEGHFQDGNRQGLWTYWDENGQKYSEGHFQDGKEQGLWTYWDENGKKISETLYEAGEIVSYTHF